MPWSTHSPTVWPTRSPPADTIAFMGEFIAATAVRSTDPAFVAQTVLRYAREHGAEAEPATDDGDVSIWPADQGWTVVVWPMGVAAAGVGGWLSRELGCQVSAVDVYDGDFWQHVAFYKGEVRDRFCSVPDHFTDDEATARRLRAEWAGDVAKLVDFFDRPSSAIEPYLVPAGGASGPAFPSDEFDLDDVWVFVDFWRKLGITFTDEGVRLCHDRLDAASPPQEGPRL